MPSAKHVLLADAQKQGHILILQQIMGSKSNQDTLDSRDKFGQSIAYMPLAVN